jgi:cyclopropane fatty-acyl-phospholipid synthase-like methyltransferase
MIDLQWYKKGWTLDIKNQSWVEDTPNQIDFIIKTLDLKGNEKILDLACGFGRHSLYLAKLGFDVTGVDITKEYINDAKNEAEKNGLKISFIHDDIRNIRFTKEYDVVLNLADGAIGYLENDEENIKIFDIISNSLKKDGKHFMDICNAEHAMAFFPKRHWEIGSKSLSLPEFIWETETKRMLYSQWEAEFGKTLEKPEKIEPLNTIRLYTKKELEKIFENRNMTIITTDSKYYGKPDEIKELQLMVYSKKIK